MKGFTLLEVLIALALLGVIAAALYGTFFSLARARDAAASGVEATRELRSTLDLLRREVSAAFWNSGNARLRFVVEDRDVFGKPASVLTFTSVTPPRVDGLPLSDQQEVTYQPRQQGEMLRLERQARDVYSSGEPIAYPQMEGLTGFLVECSADGSKWVKSWDTALNQALPKVVRITLRLQSGEHEQSFATLATPRIGVR